MKKPIIYLGLALLAITNVALASNYKSIENSKIIVAHPGVTPLIVAISKGDIEIVKKFIEYGADVNERSNGMTPLMIAARYNKVEILKILISKGARLNEKDENGYTALKYAELSNATEAIDILKQAK